MPDRGVVRRIVVADRIPRRHRAAAYYLALRHPKEVPLVFAIDRDNVGFIRLRQRGWGRRDWSIAEGHVLQEHATSPSHRRSVIRGRRWGDDIGRRKRERSWRDRDPFHSKDRATVPALLSSACTWRSS